MKKLTIILLFPLFATGQETNPFYQKNGTDEVFYGGPLQTIIRFIPDTLFAADSLPDNSKTSTKVIRLPLANKDTFVTTITTTDKTVSYTTSSVVIDTTTKKYVPPVIVQPPYTGQTLTKIDGWNAYVHLPSGYSTSGKTYSTIIFFPGLGEVGTNAALVINNGPGAYIKQGWNGNVTVDGATVEFIVISLQPSAAYPNEVAINAKIKAIKSLYRVDPARLYLTGLSHGGWCSSTFVTGDPLGGPYTYASQVAAVVEVQGVTPNDNTPYPDLFDNFVKSGGKFLGFEQRLDNRGVPTRVNRMNATVPGSAIYVQTNFGGGTHCCWSNFYGGGGLQPGNFILGGVSQNLYQWMARQSLKTTPPVVNPPDFPVGCNSNKPATYIIQPTSPNEIYIKNASAKGWKGGDTLKIPAGIYSVIEIDSFGGDPCRDIVVINSGGLVNVTGSMRFQSDVHHVKILGIGSADKYGFKCKNFSFNRVNHFTMGNIECGPNLKTATNSGGVGIYGKQDPYANQPWTHYPNYVSTKITINNCYVHDVDGEGMYIGHTYPDGDPDQGNRIPIRLDSVTISNCIVENCGWDGIQLSNARSGNLIYNNTVTNFGVNDIDGQRAGIISGGNTNSNVYSNIITNGKGNGIEFFGYGKMECYWNTITNVGNTIKNVNGEESIYGMAYLNKVEVNPKQALYIHDNQINYPKKLGIIRVWDNNNSEPINFSNNKICMTDTDISKYIFLQVGAIKTGNTVSCN